MNPRRETVERIRANVRISRYAKRAALRNMAALNDEAFAMLFGHDDRPRDADARFAIQSVVIQSSIAKSERAVLIPFVAEAAPARLRELFPSCFARPVKKKRLAPPHEPLHRICDVHRDRHDRDVDRDRDVDPEHVEHVEHPE